MKCFCQKPEPKSHKLLALTSNLQATKRSEVNDISTGMQLIKFSGKFTGQRILFLLYNL